VTTDPNADLFELTSLQRAEFDRASEYFRIIVGLQLAIAAVAVASVFISDERRVYVAALIVAVLAAAYAGTGVLYRRSRNLADRTRRLTLVKGGLGEGISSAQSRELKTRFSKRAIEAARGYDSRNYYDVGSGPGPQRLVDMIEQSAFWSADLFRHSAIRSFLWGGGAFLLAILMIALVPLPFLSGGAELNAGRVVFALAPFFLSSEVVGSGVAYWMASNDLDRLLSQIEIDKARGVSIECALVLLTEYNSSVESAPTIFPGVYRSRNAILNELWTQRS
jgi:hypothetical protein